MVTQIKHVVMLHLMIAHALTLAAQGLPATASEFATSSIATKRSVLIEVITHTSTLSAREMAATLEIALQDPEPTIRQGALAAVESRAAAPAVTSRDTYVADWQRDRADIASLRPAVIALLADPVVTVRRECIRALVALDVELSKPIVLRPDTEQMLVARFYSEPDGGVRAALVAGFASETQVASPRVQGVLVAALTDSVASVRHAGVAGLARLDANTALPLLAARLDDPDATVRAQAATTLVQFGARAASLVPRLQAALASEPDPRAQEPLRRAIAAIQQASK